MRPNERNGMQKEERYFREIMAFACVFMSGKYCKYSFNRKKLSWETDKCDSP